MFNIYFFDGVTGRRIVWQAETSGQVVSPDHAKKVAHELLKRLDACKCSECQPEEEKQHAQHQ
jgi:hypothetical protein